MSRIEMVANSRLGFDFARFACISVSLSSLPGTRWLKVVVLISNVSLFRRPLPSSPSCSDPSDSVHRVCVVRRPQSCHCQCRQSHQPQHITRYDIFSHTPADIYSLDVSSNLLVGSLPRVRRHIGDGAVWVRNFGLAVCSTQLANRANKTYNKTPNTQIYKHSTLSGACMACAGDGTHKK